jgi:type II secretory ATPase GspE/PulE/Tfp pilus assembly ATPase PilB-like protein
LLGMSPQIAAAIQSGNGLNQIRSAAIEAGMTTMAADGVRRAARGETSLEEVFRVLGYNNEQ